MSRLPFLLALVLLAGCKTIPQVEVVEVPGPTVYVEIPDQFTRDCPIEEPVSTVPMEAVRVAKARKDALEACNRNMARIRAISGTPSP